MLAIVGMNKKQKILTIVMLAIFAFFGLGLSDESRLNFWVSLGVIYAGLFFILGPTRKD
jgi:hypothetical protein